MLTINRSEDIDKMMEYHRTRDMLNLIKYFPDISPIIDLTIDEENNVAHKYGMCGVNYHDIGIVYDDGINYNISVLTTYGEEDYESIVRDIHMKIKSLHDTFYNSRKEKCQILVDNSFVE